MLNILQIFNSSLNLFLVLFLIKFYFSCVYNYNDLSSLKYSPLYHNLNLRLTILAQIACICHSRV